MSVIQPEPSNPALSRGPESKTDDSAKSEALPAVGPDASVGPKVAGPLHSANKDAADKPKSRWPFARFKAPRRLKFTREGKFFVGITLGVGFAAINTGNNLLYLLLGMLLALIIVSGLMSELSLRDLTVVRRLPLRAQVGRPHLVEIEVFNHKGRVPSYAIEVEDLRAGQPADKRCFFLKISPKSAQVAAYRRTPAKRGRDRHVGFRIATRFPFGLFEKSREVPAEGELVIYPAIDPLQLPALSAGRNSGGDASMGRGHGDDYIGLRLHRDGEDRRDIHWRKTAAVGQMVMRERAREARPDVVLGLDVVRRDDAKEDWFNAFERRIRDAASRSVAHIKRGDTILMHAAAGGVGLILCQWAKHLGATVIGTVGNDDKVTLAKKAGCRHVIVLAREKFSERVREITKGKGVRVVYDGIVKDTFLDSIDSLAPLGMMVSFGNASGPVTQFNPGILAQKGSLFLTRPGLYNYTAKREDLVRAARELFSVIKRKVVTVSINQTYPLREAAQAHRDLEARKTTGSTLLLTDFKPGKMK